jgi:hypothetical protein
LIVAEKSATFKNVATKDSHLDCRAPLTLIVALQDSDNLVGDMEQWEPNVGIEPRDFFYMF